MTTAIVNHVWQSTLVVALAGLTAWALRRNRARIRHAVWLAASLKFLLPFALLMALGNALSWRTAPRLVESSAPVIVETIQTLTEPFGALVSDVTPAPVAPARVPISIPALLAAVWAVGVVMVIALRVKGWLRVRAALRASSAATLPGLDAAISVRETPGLLEPGVVGIWRPVLLVPVGLGSTLTTEQLEAVVAHERHHIARRDNLVSTVHMVVEALFWFHPMAWWVGARLVDERERACDEHVLASGTAADAYAEAILSVCRRYVELPIACVSGVTGSDLKRRVSAIVTGAVGVNLSRARRSVLIVSAIVALALPVAVGAVVGPVRAVAQAASSVQPFEVVSVRPCGPNTTASSGAGRGGGGADASPGRLNLDCRRLLDLVDLAYGIYAGGRVNSRSERPIRPWAGPFIDRDHYPLPAGLPGWISEDRFTVEAKAAGAPPLPTMLGSMLQRILEDRFKLRVHRETRVVPVYEVVVAKGGLKLKGVTPETCIQYDFSVSPQPPPAAGQHRCTNHNERDANGDYVYVMESISVAEFFGAWSGLGRPVVDKTGIAGPVGFSFVVHGQFSNPDDEMAARIDAMRSQLGLELKAATDPLEFLVIDHVERPDQSDAGRSAPVQIPAAGPNKFDVASIRQCEGAAAGVPGGRSGGGGPAFSPGLFVYNCGSLEQLINGAYILNGDPLLNDEGRAGPGQPRDDTMFPQRIRGGPDWTRSDRFLIEAKTDISTGKSGRDAAPERATLMGPMLRALLEDRFRLKLHRAVQDDVPMYALTVAKGGLKIPPAGPDSCTPPDPNRTAPYEMTEEIETVRKGGKPICGHGIMGGPVGTNNALVLNGQTMEGVAHFLSGFMDRHVLDETGLKDKFVIYLEYARDEHVPYDFVVLPRSADPSTAPSITQALKKVGLELTPTKGQKGYLVIDHVERPKIDAGALTAGSARGGR